MFWIDHVTEDFDTPATVVKVHDIQAGRPLFIVLRFFYYVPEQQLPLDDGPTVSSNCSEIPKLRIGTYPSRPRDRSDDSNRMATYLREDTGGVSGVWSRHPSGND